MCRAELGGGGGGGKQLKIPPGVGLGGGVKFLIYFLEGGGGAGKMVGDHPIYFREVGRALF